MKKIVSMFFLMLVFSVTQAQDKIKWVGFEEAIEMSKKSKKPILVDLYTDWCGYCKKMDRETYANPVITKFINDNYLAVKFDGEGKDDVTYQGKTFKYVEFVQSNGRPGKYHELSSAILNSGKKPGERGGGFPTTAFFNSDGQLIQTVPGYLSKERFEKILAYFNLPNFRETPWPDFEQNFKSAL